ncbi:MAG: hypothetical protein JO156_07140 [Solirubrobacterales bacterium]|nr:hypothetical protein [Solirubrobacterales bacterium]
MSERRVQRPVTFPAVWAPIYKCDRCGAEADSVVLMVQVGAEGRDVYANGWRAPAGWETIRGFGSRDVCPACVDHVRAAVEDSFTNGQ